MSSKSSLCYCPVAAHYVPVTVSMSEDAGPHDALEEAVLALVGLQQGFAQQLAQTLHIGEELVESALAELERRHLITREHEGAAYRLSERGTAAGRPRECPGFVLWDSLHEQASLQVILGKVHDEPYVPEEVSVLERNLGRPPRGPKHHKLEGAVRSLADVPDLQLLVSFGHSYRPTDSARVQSITYAARRKFRTAAAFVPIEFRPMCDPIVWRPVVMPSYELQTPLDPLGYAGLKRRIPEAEQELVRLRMELDPRLLDLLRNDGFRDAADLFEQSERRVQRHLAGAWGNPDWEIVQQAAVEAMRQTILAKYLRSSLHGGLHGWADVLERAVGTLMNRLATPSARSAWSKVSDAAIGAAVPTFARTLRHLASQSAKFAKPSDKKAKDLALAVTKGTLGERLRLLIPIWMTITEIKDRMQPILREVPDFFPRLDHAIGDRNLVIHPGPSGPPNARAFRNAVLDLTRAMMLCD